ncbi:MAG: DNA polymerase III subunit gamma/tau [Bacteroidales bacterium]|nr:DNA polymerase III subunit gamma/tau [Bacteroidales bacterium]MDD2264354.1 DNA polymerase III subunit gamma/tau [Bacteroidales bacterium]MDD2831588.1 DNA polymerase III subunit gamma/tau [Bacteroidales bacterium]MDD3209455.1 DNA polymerase III subunit gamma/tau [Bacteroidales bacterium]MDD3697562.1 DNA polymerase III subunit gamma/tau [Bacteroidales bacterium]
MDQFVVSARKYRPQQFSDVVDQDNIVTTLKNAIRRKQLAHAYLFCGPRGVGKTTCARIFAKTINCLDPTEGMEACGACESCVSFAEGRSYSIHELDAASNNSVDDIRELIDKVRIPPQVGKYSVYIIDEVHMLSQSAFNAFLKTLEEPPSYALFILATTEKHKVLPTILSRCQVFDFNRISIRTMTRYLAEVAQKEEVTIGQESLQVIAQKADGAMRDALTLLDQCIAVSGKDVTYQQVISNLNVLDREYYFKLTAMALEGSYENMLVLFDEILTRGFNALHFIGGLSSHFRDLLVCKQPESLPLLEYGEETARRYRKQSQACSLPFLFRALSICTQAEAGYKQSNLPRLHIEMALIRLSQARNHSEAKEGRKEEREAPVPPQEKDVSGQSLQESIGNPVSTKNEQQAPSASCPAVSIKNLMHKNIKAKQKDLEQQSQPDDNANRDLEMKDLEKVLPGLYALFRDKPNLSATLKRCPPQILEGYMVQFSVINELQKTWIEEHYGRTIDSYLRQALRNKKVCMSLTVEESPGDTPGNTCYMPEEKAKFMAEKHPEVAALRDDLSLDIS